MNAYTEFRARGASIYPGRAVPSARRRGPAAPAGAVRGGGADRRRAGDAARREPAAGHPQEPAAARGRAAARPAGTAPGRCCGPQPPWTRGGGRRWRRGGPRVWPTAAWRASPRWSPSARRPRASSSRARPTGEAEARRATSAGAGLASRFCRCWRRCWPGRALAVDVGTGEGTLLPLLSPLYERVIAVDRSAGPPGPLRRSGSRPAGCPTCACARATVDDAGAGARRSARAAAPTWWCWRACSTTPPARRIWSPAAARLLRAGGHLALVDYLPHDDETPARAGPRLARLRAGPAAQLSARPRG